MKFVHPPICVGKHYDTDTDWTLYVNTDTDSDSLSLHTPCNLMDIWRIVADNLIFSRRHSNQKLNGRDERNVC